jgi:hypothetical protein
VILFLRCRVAPEIGVLADLANAGVLGGGLIGESAASGGVLHGRRGDRHGRQVADRVGDGVPLPACGLLACVAREAVWEVAPLDPGAVHVQRASGRSLGYGRCVGMLRGYRCEVSAPRRTAMTAGA